MGANLLRRLLTEGHRVAALVRPGGEKWRLAGVGNEIERLEGDLRDYAAVAAAVERARPDWIFHLAASGAYWWQTDVLRIVATNVTGTIGLLEAASRAGFEAFVHAGSSSEYGFKDHAPSEDEPIAPNSAYAAAKAAATLYCARVARDRGFPIVTLRLYSVYGPFEEPRRLMPTLVVRGLDGELPPLAGPETARDFVYADDAVDAFLLAASAASGLEPGAIYNVGSGVQTSLSEVVELARSSFSIGAPPAWGTQPPRAWDTAVWVADTAKIAAELGWRPQYTLEQGFGRLVEWLSADPLLDEVYRPALRGLAG